jgi:hypothetical protein
VSADADRAGWAQFNASFFGLSDVVELCTFGMRHDSLVHDPRDAVAPCANTRA